MHDDGEVLRSAAELLAIGEDDEARRRLGDLSLTDPIHLPHVTPVAAARGGVKTPRPAYDKRLAAVVLSRDGWRCAYCGRRLVGSFVIDIIGVLCPVEFRFPPGHAMPEKPPGRTHPAAVRVYPNVDHREAGSVSGDWTDSRNLIAACTPCNQRKSASSGWTTLNATVPDDGWDGGVGVYPALLERADVPRRQFHRQWLDALTAAGLVPTRSNEM